MFDITGWVGSFHSIHDGRDIESQQRMSNFGSRFPPVVDATQILVEELLQVIVCRFLIQVVPLLGVVDSEPSITH